MYNKFFDDELKKHLEGRKDLDAIILCLRSLPYTCKKHIINYRTRAYLNAEQMGSAYDDNIINLIVHFWDTAYNYGFHDAQADEGLTLAEMND